MNFLQGHEDIYHRPNKKVNCETKILRAENLNLWDDTSRFSVFWNYFEYLKSESIYREGFPHKCLELEIAVRHKRYISRFFKLDNFEKRALVDGQIFS